jgi:hypothetical protein
MKPNLTRGGYASALAGFFLAVAFTPGTFASAATITTATRMAALPGHFGIGLRSTQNELTWMTNSRVPWEYRYQYINPGWESWNSPLGQFAYNYANDSVNNGYVPVFDWYLLAGQDSAMWNDLVSPSYMKSYYSSFALLMQKIAATGTMKPVIVHLEPDMWGFMQQKYGDDPTIIPVSVASSGFAGLSSLPNNAAGLAQALVSIRNTYAPNIILAWHASRWGPNNGYDPTLTNPASYQTPQVTGSRLVTFYDGLNAQFDMMFHDTSDRDSDFAVAVCGTSSNVAWWNDNAFASFKTYLAGVYQGTGLDSMLWATPEGNTLYRSDNNANYHYQDNRAQYFLQSGNTQHILDYMGAGVIGILFGLGQQAPYSQCNSAKSDTSHMDYAGDGITNPPAIDGNTLVASYPDDDGGFIRTAAAAYYAAGPISFTSPPPPPPPPAVTASLSASPASITAGQSSTLSWISANANSCAGAGFNPAGAASGSVAVKPPNTTTYTLTCSGSNGSATSSAAVIVQQHQKHH